MARLGATNARQLADALGMDDIDRESRARRWVNGKNAPSFDYTMLMLSTAGLLNAAGERVWEASQAADPLASVEAATLAARSAEESAGQAALTARTRRGAGAKRPG